MTDAQTMKAEVADIIQKSLAHLTPTKSLGNKFSHPEYLALREAINNTEQALRQLIRGNEIETHEWLAVIHYALADERARLLS